MAPDGGRALHLHEVIDIVGEGAVPYMEESVVGFDADATADRGLELLGTWYVMGSTGRWPQVVTIWEMADGWDSWHRLCAATNLRREANDELRQWWREAYERRSGGFDRLLGPMGSTRSLDALRHDAVGGTLFVHELSTVHPGEGPAYLDAIDATWAPTMAEHGHELVGLWENVLDDTEVCTVWATDLDAHVALGAATDRARGVAGGAQGASADADVDERLAAWRAQRRTWCTRWHEELMIPCPGTPLGPEAWAT